MFCFSISFVVQCPHTTTNPIPLCKHVKMQSQTQLLMYHPMEYSGIYLQVNIYRIVPYMYSYSSHRPLLPPSPIPISFLTAYLWAGLLKKKKHPNFVLCLLNRYNLIEITFLTSMYTQTQLEILHSTNTVSLVYGFLGTETNSM